MEKLARTISSSAATLAIPWILLRGVVNKNWRGSLSERCGLGLWAEDAWHEREVVWFHGASVGEIAGLRPLLGEIRKTYPELHLLVTTTSVTGRKEVEKQGLGDSAALFPLDHPLYIRRVFERVRPKVIVLSETELWPNFLFLAQRLGVPVILINGRISDHSFPKYLKFKSLFGPVLNTIERILVQTEQDRERFIGIGADPQLVRVVGSTKYSQRLPVVDSRAREQLAKELGIDLGRPCFVAGSVRAAEDETVIRAYVKAKKSVPDLQMIIAPRHPERFAKVARILGKYSLEFSRRSARAATNGHGPSTATAPDVLLLDTIGELTRTYSICDFAFVGGSLVNIGGHNPFEPAAYKAAVLFGPYAGNVKDAVEELKEHGGLMSVHDESELSQIMIRLASNRDECLMRGTKAFEVWREHSGAMNEVIPVLTPYLEA